MRTFLTLLSVAALTLTTTAPSAASVLTVSWHNNDPNADGVLLERASNPSGPFTVIVHLDPMVTAYADVTLTAGRTYCYRARAFNAAGVSEASNIGCGVATTPALPVVAIDLLAAGTTLSVTATVVPGTTPTLVDAYVVLRLPDGRLFSLTGINGFALGVVPAAVAFSPAPFTGEVFRHTFTGIEPHGTYTWYAALVATGTLTPLGPVAQASVLY